MSHYNHELPNPNGTIFGKHARNATKRQLAVVLDKCKHCNHRKAIVNQSYNAKVDQKCARCKR